MKGMLFVKKEGRGLLIKYFLSIPMRVDLSAEDPE
jgi:hypothetical protein